MTEALARAWTSLEQMDKPFWNGVRSSRVLGGGASRSAFMFSHPDGRSAVVKGMNTLVDEVVVANNLINLVASVSEGGHTAVAPRSRVAELEERVLIRVVDSNLRPAPLPRVGDPGPRWANVPVSLVISEPMPGVPFSQVIAEGYDPPLVGKDRSVYRALAKGDGPARLFGRVYAVDLVVGMIDHFLPHFNPDNFLYDAATQTFAFVDNVKSSTEAMGSGDPATWRGSRRVGKLRDGRYGELADDMVTSVADGIAECMRNPLPTSGHTAHPTSAGRVVKLFAENRATAAAAMADGIEAALGVLSGLVPVARTGGVAMSPYRAIEPALAGVRAAEKERVRDELLQRLAHVLGR